MGPDNREDLEAPGKPPRISPSQIKGTLHPTHPDVAHSRLTDFCRSQPSYSRRSGPRAVSRPCPHTCTCRSAGPLRGDHHQSHGPILLPEAVLDWWGCWGEPRRDGGHGPASLQSPPCLPDPGPGTCRVSKRQRWSRNGLPPWGSLPPEQPLPAKGL